jgi:hypothetical protein
MNDRERFAYDYGFRAWEVNLLVRLARRACDANAHACNGDPHRENPDRTDANANAVLWTEDRDAASEEIAAIVKPLGFTVEFSGLRPHLEKDGKYIEIPR